MSYIMIKHFVSPQTSSLEQAIDSMLRDLPAQGNNEEGVYLNLAAGQLDELQAESLIEILKKCKDRNIHTLDLRNYNIGNRYALFSSILKATPSAVQTLDLRDNSFLITEETCKTVQSLWSSLPSELSELYIDINIKSDNSTNVAYEQLFDKLPKNLKKLHLKIINLNNRHASDTSAVLKNILAALPDTQMSLFLDLRHYRIQKDPNLTLAARQLTVGKIDEISTDCISALPENIALKSVDFSGDNSLHCILPVEERKLLESLPATVTKLSFAQRGYYSLYPPTYNQLFASIKHLEKLEELDLSDLRCLGSIYGAIDAIPRPLNTLYYNHNAYLTFLSVEQLQGFFGRMSGIKALYLEGINFTWTGANLIEALKALPPETKIYDFADNAKFKIKNEVLHLYSDASANESDSTKENSALEAARIVAAINGLEDSYSDELKDVMTWAREKKSAPLITSESSASTPGTLNLFQKVARESYKDFYKRDSKQFCKSLLEDYCSNNFWRGHWNRHHVGIIKKVLADFDKLYEQHGNNPKDFKTFISSKITGTEAVDNQATSKPTLFSSSRELKAEGSLARRLDSCIAIHETTQTLTARSLIKIKS